MKSTDRIICLSPPLYSRTFSWTLVRILPETIRHTLIGAEAYDVNVSPDKRTILLHEQAKLLESLKVRRNHRLMISFLTLKGIAYRLI